LEACVRARCGLESYPADSLEERLWPGMGVRPVTEKVVPDVPIVGEPGRNPTATLAGMPRVRSMTAMDPANCWQNPSWSS